MVPCMEGSQIWSPMAEISTLLPQLEHLIAGKKPASGGMMASQGEV